MSLPKPLIAASELGAWMERVRLLDARVSPSSYARAHLRGALHADLERHLSAPGDDAQHGGRHPLPPVERWAERLGLWGIAPSTPVVVYDDEGGMKAAARAWWMLRAVGHAEVAVLDGGWQAALQQGLPTDDRVPDVESGAPYPVDGWKLPLVGADEVERARQDARWRVLDARAAERFCGEVEPLDPVAGHIPGARNVPCGSNLGDDGRFQSPEELGACYRRALGDVPPERTIVHCGSGVTACHDLLALEVAGMPGAALYVGSWSEWCRSGRPRSS